MANQLTQNPWVLDTPGTIFSRPVAVEYMEFSDFSSSTDAAVVTDINGVEVFKAVAGTDLSSPVRSGRIGWLDGLILSSIVNGKVKVFIR